MAVSIITTVLTAARAAPRGKPYDLTDIATVHDELNITIPNDVKNDPFLLRAITQASTSIAKYCNRVFPVEALQDQIFIQQDPYPWQVPGGVYPLQLSRWPLVNSSVVAFTGNTHGTNVIDGIASTAGLTIGMLVFAADGSIPQGTTIQTTPAANSITLTQAATSSEASLSLNTGVQVVQTLTIGQTQTLVYGTDFTIDPALGSLIRLDKFTGVGVKWEAIPTTVQYQAGYSTIPPDLIDACLRLVTSRFTARGRDPTLVQRDQPQLGTTRYWVGTAPGQTGAFAPEILGLIEPYRVPVSA